ncbi:MAG: hypothetical protein WB952_18125 [Terriglobales bacterium]
MRHWLALAALGAAFLVMPALAQRRGGGSAGFGGHAGFASGGAMGGMRGPAITNRGFGGLGRGGMRGGGGFHGRPFPGSFGGRAFHHHYPRYYGYGYGYPGWSWYGNYSYYPDYSYYVPSYDYAPDDYAQDSQTDQQQQNEIDRLNHEVARLREERRAQTPHPSPQTQWDRDSETTQLVFRDKHTEEIQNYAIVGQTLWVFTEQRAKKIMLAELDLPATKKANDDRGVDFRIPR